MTKHKQTILKGNVMVKLESILTDLEAVIKETDGEERAAMLSRLNSYIRVITNKYSEKVNEARKRNAVAARVASEKSPKSKIARAANMDTARLSRLSVMIVKKLGREPMPGDLVPLGSKSYIFGGAPGGVVVVSMQEKGEIRECVFNWKNGRLERI